MSDLVVPKPLLTPAEMLAGLAVVNQPVAMSCGPVTFDDGTALRILDVDDYGAFVEKLMPGQVLVWNKTARTWQDGAAVAAADRELIGMQLDESSGVWTAGVLFIGPEGKFDSTDPIAGFPRYRARCQFRATHPSGATAERLSPPSDPLSIASLDDPRAGLEVVPKPAVADELRIFLDDGAGNRLGVIELARSGSNGRLRLTTYRSTGAVRARIEMRANGEIELAARPGSGSTVLLDDAGKLELKSTSARIVLDGGAIDLYPASRVRVHGDIEVDTLYYGVGQHLP